MSSTAAWGETVYGELVYGRNRGGRGSMPDRRGALWPAEPEVGVISGSSWANDGRQSQSHTTRCLQVVVSPAVGGERLRSTRPGMAALPPGSVGIGQGPGSACRDRAACLACLLPACQPRQRGRGHRPHHGGASLGFEGVWVSIQPKCAHTGSIRRVERSGRRPMGSSTREESFPAVRIAVRAPRRHAPMAVVAVDERAY